VKGDIETLESVSAWLENAIGVPYTGHPDGEPRQDG